MFLILFRQLYIFLIVKYLSQLGSNLSVSTSEYYCLYTVYLIIKIRKNFESRYSEFRNFIFQEAILPTTG